ncbi:hypothetical protein NAT51_04095 [Flavobacterium amniphilum]|uniref:hypothetical protein n=1 Tax=Flavobacterium amniphilum TaxID=1834035 RepID=UPI00202A3FE7|nr:hypothetical protein [Flavobacterium amniphilum]MCL9804689.1 hypothetical protein [Flavobacterium amniphilum]
MKSIENFKTNELGKTAKCAIKGGGETRTACRPIYGSPYVRVITYNDVNGDGQLGAGDQIISEDVSLTCPKTQAQ